MAGGQPSWLIEGRPGPRRRGSSAWIAGSDGPIGGIRSKSCRKTYPSGRSSDWTLSLPSSLRTLSHCTIATPTHCARLLRSSIGFGRALNLNSGRSCHNNVNSRFRWCCWTERAPAFLGPRVTRVVRTPGRWRSAKPSAIKDRVMSVLIGLWLSCYLVSLACAPFGQQSRDDVALYRKCCADTSTSGKGRPRPPK